MALVDDTLDELREENRQLRTRVARLTGYSDVALLRRTFRFTQKQAAIVCLLLNRGIAERSELLDVVYAPEELVMLDNTDFALGSLVKHIRRTLRAHGIDIDTYYALGFGMSDENRAKLRSMLPSPETIRQAQFRPGAPA
jgi:hypothetical protein